MCMEKPNIAVSQCDIGHIQNSNADDSAINIAEKKNSLELNILPLKLGNIGVTLAWCKTCGDSSVVHTSFECINRCCPNFEPYCGQCLT